MLSSGPQRTAIISKRKEKIMIEIHLERDFNVSPELLWELVVDPDHYSFWIGAFSEGAYFDGDWTKGSNIRFLGDNENGMLSEIVESQ